MYWLRRGVILIAIFFSFSFIAWFVPRALDPTSKAPAQRAKDRRWVASSPYLWDRLACRWISLCGLHHLRHDPASHFPHNDFEDQEPWGELRRRALRWEDDEQKQPRQDRKRNVHQRRKILRDVPEYVNKYAPLVHLYSGEEFFPSDIREHLEHVTVYIDDIPLNSTEKWTMHNLHELNQRPGRITLRSNDNVEERPSWLHSHHNIPDQYLDDKPGFIDDTPVKGKPPKYGEDSTWFDTDKSRPLHRVSDPRKSMAHREKLKQLNARGHKPDANGYSAAPAVLVLVDKGSGIVDAFWFFFYSYNLGQTVFNIRFGNHVGDWEHCMIRFQNGVPRGVFLSEHEGGQAYVFDSLEKRGVRPVIYSAFGSHANYAMPNDHAYILPFKILKDQTDKGPLWDPSLNKYAYHYDYTMEETDDEEIEPQNLVPAASNPLAPTSWFHFRGFWGDEVYTLADYRQWRLFGQYHYVTGPDGPRFKHLDRSKMCKNEKCKLLYKVDKNTAWY